MDDAEYVIERHKLSRNQLRALKDRPYFIEDAIEEAVATGSDYVRKHWEMKMEDDDSISSESERWEVLEFWGYVDKEVLEENGIKIPKELQDLYEISANIWTVNGRVIRCVLNPFKPARIPYYAVPFEHNPYSFFGVGIAENMDDTQTLMNGFMRMAVDNAVLSGNLLIEIDETNLVLRTRHECTSWQGLSQTGRCLLVKQSLALSFQTLQVKTCSYLIRQGY